MSPHFQAHEGNPDIQGSVKLKTHTEESQHHLSTPLEIMSPFLAQALRAQIPDFSSTRASKGRREQVLLFTFSEGGHPETGTTS